MARASSLRMASFTWMLPPGYDIQMAKHLPREDDAAPSHVSYIRTKTALSTDTIMHIQPNGAIRHYHFQQYTERDVKIPQDLTQGQIPPPGDGWQLASSYTDEVMGNGAFKNGLPPWGHGDYGKECCLAMATSLVDAGKHDDGVPWHMDSEEARSWQLFRVANERTQAVVYLS